MSDAKIEEKRQMVLDSLNFLVEERNKSLFQLSRAKINLKEAQQQESKARKRAKQLKSRLLYEIDQHIDILRTEDKENLIGGQDEE